MSLADLIPVDTNPSLRFAPSAQTRRVYDRNVYMNDTAFTIAPTVEPLGPPVRVTPDSATVYPKRYDATLLDPTGTDPNLAGVWYADVIVSNDPDVTPGEVYVTISHPHWIVPETRKVPTGTTNVCWSDLATAVPPQPTQIVFAGGTPIVVLDATEPLPLGLPNGTLVARPLN